MTSKRCLFCEREVCDFFPEGNPFKDAKEYRDAMKKYEELKHS